MAFPSWQFQNPEMQGSSRGSDSQSAMKAIKNNVPDNITSEGWSSLSYTRVEDFYQKFQKEET